MKPLSSLFTIISVVVNSDETSMQSGMLIDEDVAVAKPEDMRLFPTATANPPGGFVDSDSDSSRSDPKRRLICCILLVLIILGAVGGPLLGIYWDEISLWFDDTDAPTAIPTIATPAPTSSPTFGPTIGSPYDRNTDEQCSQISRGDPVAGQDTFESKTFDVRMDVSLTVLTSDTDGMIVSPLQSRLQQILGPRIADCPEGRRLREESVPRLLQVEKHAVANALFDSKYQPEQSCTAGAPTPCVRALTQVTLFLKGAEKTLELVTLLTNIFGEGEEGLVKALGLTEAVFTKVEVMGVAVTSPTLPLVPETPSPTAGPITLPPTSSTTPNPTKI